MQESTLTICYIIASVTFILGLKMLSHPATARRGNLIAAGGMSLAVLATIFLYHDENGNALHNYGWIFGGIAIGGVVGVFVAKKVKMTAMPEMVSLFNGMGGACAALISIVEYNHLVHRAADGLIARGELLIILSGLIIGTISFTGSMIAWGKLNGRIKDFAFKGQHVLNLLLLLIIACTAAWLIYSPGKGEAGISDHPLMIFYFILLLSVIYGVFFVLPIGGADMPVVISLLNSFTGVAAACGGFLYDNKAMLTGGILVGAAGTLLTILMCKAMNRSLLNVLIGSFGGNAQSGTAAGKQQGAYKEISLSDAAVVMNYANKVFIVPGYGLAVAQAQHACHELEKLLTERGVEVKYAIHPVAGRMPGHMNVLLAESNVPYSQLMDMEEINPDFPNADVVIVIGANDVVNPAARHDTNSPIYGMPILDADKAKNVIIMKRSMNVGYAGIDNELFYYPNAYMFFGDAKKSLERLVDELNAL